MQVLAFDMTGPRLTVGLADNGRAVGRWDGAATRGRSGTLDSLIDSALSEAGWTRRDIEGVGLVTGPGSLTATRIGWATASGWALAGGIPVTGWSTPSAQSRWWCHTDALAALGVVHVHDQPIICVVHHRGDEFYTYDLSRDGQNQPVTVTLGGPVRPGNQPCILVGSGVLGYRDRWIESLAATSTVISEDHCLVGGDTLALWAEEAIGSDAVFDPLQSPLDYGLPPQFRKAS